MLITESPWSWATTLALSPRSLRLISSSMKKGLYRFLPEKVQVQVRVQVQVLVLVPVQVWRVFVEQKGAGVVQDG